MQPPWGLNVKDVSCLKVSDAVEGWTSEVSRYLNLFTYSNSTAVDPDTPGKGPDTAPRCAFLAEMHSWHAILVLLQ